MPGGGGIFSDFGAGPVGSSGFPPSEGIPVVSRCGSFKLAYLLSRSSQTGIGDRASRNCRRVGLLAIAFVDAVTP